MAKAKKTIAKKTVKKKAAVKKKIIKKATKKKIAKKAVAIKRPILKKKKVVKKKALKLSAPKEKYSLIKYKVSKYRSLVAFLDIKPHSRIIYANGKYINFNVPKSIAAIGFNLVENKNGKNLGRPTFTYFGKVKNGRISGTKLHGSYICGYWINKTKFKDKQFNNENLFKACKAVMHAFWCSNFNYYGMIGNSNKGPSIKSINGGSVY